MSEDFPMLNSGIQTVIPPLATQQVVYLDFDGAETSYYNRDLDITVSNIIVEDSGFASQVISVIVASLNEQFGDDVIFTAECPSEEQFSTIYIGVTSAFDEYGSFLGLAETIDSGNQIPDDNAFVLLNSAASVELVTSVIAHEAEHIVHGMEHEGEGLTRYAELITIGSGTTKNGLVITSGTTLSVTNGGKANFTTVISSARMHISSGGKATATTLDEGGWLYVSKGGTATDTTVNIGLLRVSNGGKAIHTDVNSGGFVRIYKGGIATSTRVNEEGHMFISSGGTANSTSVDWATMDIYRAGTANYTTVEGGTLEIHEGGIANYTILQNSWMDVFGGGTVNHTNVYNGTVLVYENATANFTTVKEDAFLEIHGIANSTNVNGGTFNVPAGVANNTTVNLAGYMNIWQEGTANSTIVNSNGRMLLDEGGTANDTIVNSGASVCTAADAILNNVTVSSGGVITLDGGEIRGCIVIGGVMYIGGEVDASGAIIDYAVNQRGTNEEAIIDNLSNLTGATFAVTVSSSQEFGEYILAYEAEDFTGTITIHSADGTEFGVLAVGERLAYDDRLYSLYSDWSLRLSIDGLIRIFDEYGDFVSADVSEGLTVQSGYRLVVSSCGSVLDTTVEGYGLMEVLIGGTADYTTLAGGQLYVDGITNDTVVDGGYLTIGSGIANRTAVGNGGQLYIAEGTANRTTVNNGGVLEIDRCGTASNTTVNSGGSLRVHNGGTLTGSNVLGGTMQVIETANASGAIIDFAVSQRDTNDDAIVTEGFSNLVGATFAVTVSASQKVGEYILAYGAGGFDGTITLKNTSDVYYGTLSVGNTITAKNNDYTLLLNSSGILSLQIEEGIDNTAPVIDTVVDKTEWTTESVTLTATFTDDGSGIALKQYKFAQAKEWKTYTKPLVSPANRTVYLRAVDNVGNETTKTIKISNIDKTVPVINAVVDNTEWTTGSVTLTAAFKDTGSGIALKQYKYSKDGEWKTYKKPLVSVANRTVYLRAVDNAGNETTKTVKITNIDKKKPTIDIVADDTELATGSVTLTATFTDAGSGIASMQYKYAADGTWCMYTQPLVATANGTVYFRAVDNAGNETTKTFEVTTIDETESDNADNWLFGDGGNDWIAGTSGDDVIVGGAGDDTLQGGGGNDLFAFGGDWGNDTVEQLADGKVTLWFDEGDESKWDASTLVYKDGGNSVTVSGVALENITLKFGDDGSSLYDSLLASGAFNAFTNESFLNDKDKGMLA